MDPGSENNDPTTTTTTASTPIPLDPVSGAALYDLEVSRRRALAAAGSRPRLAGTGCPEIDREVLLCGGFERGSVVGVSAEDVDFGVLLGLQTIAHTLVFGQEDDTEGRDVQQGALRSRAAIITTLPATALLPLLRDVIRAQVLSKLGVPPAAARGHGPHQDAKVITLVRACLERISVSQVFDIEGLWEVIGELETPPPPSQRHSSEPQLPVTDEHEGVDDDVDAGGAVGSSSELSDPPASSQISVPETASAAKDSIPKPPVGAGRDRKGEILDSEDEGEDLSPSPSPPLPPLPSPGPSAKAQTARENDEAQGKNEKKAEEKRTSESREKKSPNLTYSHMPDMILITHFSSLLTTLFTRRDRAGAHSALALLSSHLRYLARTPAGPLIMLLNTTSSSPPSNSAIATNANPNPEHNRPLDPTLRSIFNSNNSGGQGAVTGRINKPAYGATFAGLLDAHLLCTRVPRARADAEALLAAPGAATATARYAWVIEVLMDEVGVWEWLGEDGEVVPAPAPASTEKEVRWRRRSREQRWGAVDVRDGVRIVDAFVS